MTLHAVTYPLQAQAAAQAALARFGPPAGAATDGDTGGAPPATPASRGKHKETMADRLARAQSKPSRAPVAPGQLRDATWGVEAKLTTPPPATKPKAAVVAAAAAAAASSGAGSATGADSDERHAKVWLHAVTRGAGHAVTRGAGHAVTRGAVTYLAHTVN